MDSIASYLLVIALVTPPVGVNVEWLLRHEVAGAERALDGGEVGTELGGVRTPLAFAHEAFAHVEVLQSLHGAVI